MTEESVWYYVDSQTNSRRGPIPTSVVRRLLQKGIGVMVSTLVWKAGMTEWLPVSELPEFGDVVRFQTTYWYYMDQNHEQKGPVLSRFLLHLLKEGGISEMTSVFGDELTAWTPLSEVPILKMELQKIAEEEESLQRLSAADAAEQVFNPDRVFQEVEQVQPEEFVFAPEEVGRRDEDKYVTGSDGLRVRFDEEDQHWTVEEESRNRTEDDDVPLMDEEDADGGDSRYRKRKLSQRHESADVNDDIDDNDSDSQHDVEESNAQQDDLPKDSSSSSKDKKKKKRRKKTSLWVYVTGLPTDITVEELKSHFSKVGLLAISPYDQQPSIKIYKDPETGLCKGDASLCYVAEKSAKLAIDILNEGFIRPGVMISVTRATFDAAPSSGSRSVSQAQIKIARNASRQALAWCESDDAGISKASSLRIIVLEGMFTPSEFQDPQFEVELEADVASECQKFGEIDKMTIFSRNAKGVIVVKFTTAYAAQECIKVMNGRFFGANKIKSYFWDGVTNFSIIPKTQVEEEAEEKEEDDRLEEWGDWLDKEQDNLPEEFRLRTE